MAVVNLDVWKQQRSVLHGTLAGSAYAIVSVGGWEFRHLCKASGEYLIDVTDIVRVFGTGASIEVTFYNSSDTALQVDTYNIVVRGNINPERYIIPRTRAGEFIMQEYGVGYAIMPPTMLLQSYIAPSLLAAMNEPQGATWIVQNAGVRDMYYKQIEVDMQGGELLIKEQDTPLQYDFTQWDETDQQDVTTPYASATGRLVEMRASGMIIPPRVFFSQFCALNTNYHVTYRDSRRSHGFIIKIKDAISGDVELPTVWGADDVCSACEYVCEFDFVLDGENAHVKNFTATKVTPAIFKTTQQPLLCEKRYACVEWVGRTGYKKRTTWQVEVVTDMQNDAQELLHVQNAYNVRMGLEQKMTLRLDSLNAYDYWYYSDIVTSPDVRVALSASDYDSASDKLRDSARVQVTTKNVKQRDGDAEFGTLKVEINYRRYDAI